jgi:hypothetical protein
MIMSLKKIKGVGAIVVFFSAAICPTQGAAAIPIVASILSPVIAELAANWKKDAGPKIANGVKSLGKKSVRCAICTKTGGASCKKESAEQFCKSTCQERVEMGSNYVLKIRFTDKWNIRTCLEAARKIRTDRTDKNPREIAIYNKKDLELATDLISIIVAGDHIIAHNGNIEDKETDQTDASSKNAEEIKQKIADAKQARDEALKNLIIAYDPDDLGSAKNLIEKIMNNERIILTHETDVKKSPKEILKEAQEKRDEAIASLEKMLSEGRFGPQ